MDYSEEADVPLANPCRRLLTGLNLCLYLIQDEQASQDWQPKLERNEGEICLKVK